MIQSYRFHSPRQQQLYRMHACGANTQVTEFCWYAYTAYRYTWISMLEMHECKSMYISSMYLSIHFHIYVYIPIYV